MEKTHDTPGAQVSAEQSAAAPRGEVDLRQIMARVRRDSNDQPEAYLDETEVPHGGE